MWDKLRRPLILLFPLPLLPLSLSVCCVCVCVCVRACVRFRKRDRARIEMNDIFKEVIRKRRENPDEEDKDDILNTLIHATYK